MLRISEFLISFFVFYLQNFYSELSATWTDCDVQLKIFIQYTDVRCPRCFSISSCGCVCVRVARLCRCMGVRARQSICQILLGPRRVASSRFVSLSFSPSLFVLHAQQILFWNCIWWLSIYKRQRGEKERERERAEHNNANNNSLAPSLFLPLSLFLSLSPGAFTCPCAWPCVFRLYDFEYFPIFLSFILTSIFISMHLYLFVFLLLIFFFWYFSQLFLTFSYWYAKKQKSSLPKTHIHTWYTQTTIHTYISLVIFYRFLNVMSTSKRTDKCLFQFLFLFNLH